MIGINLLIKSVSQEESCTHLIKIKSTLRTPKPIQSYPISLHYLLSDNDVKSNNLIEKTTKREKNFT